MTRHVGTTDEVVTAFVNDRTLRTVSAQVPGGYRVRSEDGDLSAMPNGVTRRLYSYRTAIAERRKGGTFAVGLREYTAATSQLQSNLRGTLSRAGYRPTRVGDAALIITTIHAAVPGRYGGFGIPWHATGWEDVPAEVWTR